MSDTVCTCERPEFHWRLDDCNERGWHCIVCTHPAPSTTPGYRPDLDQERIRDKVDAVLLMLHEHDFVYVSNSDMGDHVVARVAKKCKAVKRFDQLTILRFLCETLDDGHGEFWAKQAQQWREGKVEPERQLDLTMLLGERLVN